MEIYKGASAFAGIAIGKIQFYRKGEYQLRQHQADDIKTEQRNFDIARRHVMQTLKEEYDSAGISEAIEHQVLEQAELLGSGSFLRAVQSMISGEKVTAAYAVQTTRDELNGTFSNLKDPSIKERIHNVSRVSDLLLEILGKEEKKINLGEEPVILAADALSPAELMEMDKDKLCNLSYGHPCQKHGYSLCNRSRNSRIRRGMGRHSCHNRWLYRNSLSGTGP